jgi:hypothetical protein
VHAVRYRPPSGANRGFQVHAYDRSQPCTQARCHAPSLSPRPFDLFPCRAFQALHCPRQPRLLQLSAPRTAPSCPRQRPIQVLPSTLLRLPDLPVRPLLVQHAVPAVAAPNGLAALELHIAVAVTARVGDCARVDVDSRGVGRLRGLRCVAGHCGVRGRLWWDFVWFGGKEIFSAGGLRGGQRRCVVSCVVRCGSW